MSKKKHASNLDNPLKKSQDYNNSIPNQRSRMLQAFKENPRRSTFAFRNMGIISPAARILELKLCHDIITEWTNEPDQNGVIHHIAEYVYLGKNEDGGN